MELNRVCAYNPSMMTDNWKKRPHISKEKAKQTGSSGWYSRGYIPHFTGDLFTQSVTFRLFDSMPQTVLNRWKTEMNHLPEKERRIELSKRIDAYLDLGYGSCFMKDERIADIVEGC